METGRTPLLEMRGIVKRFGPALVNDHVDFTVYPGEVHALLGENGAGKTTLMNILYGMYQPNEGEIRIRGKAVQITSPKISLERGVGMVHQHFMLVDSFSSAENVYLMSSKPFWAGLHKREMKRELQALADKYNMEVDLSSPVNKLTVGMQQRVEILKLLYVGADILILDEPTSVLAPQECEALFRIIRKLVEHDKSIIFISHKLEEVLQISDRITVLRQGRVAETMKNENLDKPRIIEMLIGGTFRLETPEKPPVRTESVALEVRNLAAKDSRGVRTLQGVSFQVHKGEIVGVTGLEGNGQDELMDVLAGLNKPLEGSIRVEGADLTGQNTEAFIRNGVAYVPSDRNNVATVRKIPLYENWEMRRHRAEKGAWLLNSRRMGEDTRKAIADYDIRVAGYDARTENLSGGNLQKFILARELSKEPDVFVCSNPTRGIDVKASWAIRNRLLEARAAGMAVVISSGDMEELFYLADRLLVLYRGSILAEADPKQITVNELGSLMLGVVQA